MRHELVEAGTVTTGGSPSRRKIAIISEGWGSSGYYSREILSRDGPKVFREGTLMYLDHPSRTEAMDRPERSVKDLAAKIATTPFMEGNTLVAEAEIFPVWRETIDALADTIGLSIRAYGEAEFGEAEGRQGNIVQRLDDSASVDFVTEAGRGGRVMELIESARRSADMVNPFLDKAYLAALVESRVQETTHKENTVNEAERITALEAKVAELTGSLEEAKTRLVAETARADRGEDALARVGAEKVVRESVKSIEGLPDRAYDRAVQAALRDKLPMIEGTNRVDLERLKERGRKSAEEERDYLQESTGGTGRVTGLGGSTTFSEAGNSDETIAALEESFKGLGLSDEAAKIAAGGR